MSSRINSYQDTAAIAGCNDHFSIDEDRRWRKAKAFAVSQSPQLLARFGIISHTPLRSRYDGLKSAGNFDNERRRVGLLEFSIFRIYGWTSGSPDFLASL